MPDASPETVAQFIARREKSVGSEKANYALFFTELCDEILHVPQSEHIYADVGHENPAHHD